MPFSLAADGVRARIRLTPKAARDRITGTKLTVDGCRELAVSVTAAPERGRANAALIALLAREWSLPKGAIRIISGETDRHKLLALTDDPAPLMLRLQSWFEEYS